MPSSRVRRGPSGWFAEPAGLPVPSPSDIPRPLEGPGTRDSHPAIDPTGGIVDLRDPLLIRMYPDPDVRAYVASLSAEGNRTYDPVEALRALVPILSARDGADEEEIAAGFALIVEVVAKYQQDTADDARDTAPAPERLVRRVEAALQRMGMGPSAAQRVGEDLLSHLPWQ